MFDEALIGELATLDLSPFKLVIFGSTVVLDDSQRELIALRVATARRHVVFTGYVGWSNGREIGGHLATSANGILTSGREFAAPVSTLMLDDATEEQKLEPPKFVPVYNVPDSHVAGRWSDGSTSAAWREDGSVTWWSFGISPTSPGILQIGRASCRERV